MGLKFMRNQLKVVVVIIVWNKGTTEDPYSQLHLIFCNKLPGSISESDYSCVFGENEEKMSKVIDKLERKVEDRRNILDN